MKVYELLATRDKWTQRSFARNIDDVPVLAESSDAASWCLAGAAVRCYGKNSLEFYNVLKKINASLKTGIFGFNDHPDRTYEEVFALVKELDV